MSAPGMTNAQTELRVTIRRTSEWHLKKPLRTRIDDFIRSLQSRDSCRLSDEEIVLCALAYSSDKWLSRSQIGEFAFSKIRFLQTQAARFFFGTHTYHGYGHGAHDLTRRVERYAHKSL
jgi:hypothetical protein